MSFITKRERVFNEYDLLDLPARNEGKLKAYASCTDARAWSHFCSDKSEHLVEIIKRNNETVRPKYIPTDVIVNTLMTAKNAEIARLKRKIEEFEQMLSAYDQLDLTCEQKCDIANAHAAIKAANKELDEMCLDLDLSGFTEGIDSEAFETGKSRGDEPSRHTEEMKSCGGETGKSAGDDLKVRGDEWSFDKSSTPRKETKGNQAGNSCVCDASTSGEGIERGGAFDLAAHDHRIDEMKETIISKDAKLSAMQNTIAVMENDVCEPYCIYAHIYTALEKIFGTLCQNGKYKQYLDLLTAGKDTRCIDIKGKILFKMKVLEKFSLALIAPCSQDFNRSSQNCSCYRAEVVTRVETTFALTSAESQKPSLDNKRAQLVADIMENQEMKEILSKDSMSLKFDEDQFDECYGIDNYSIDVENLNRLKNLQANYDELLHCYDNLKHERDCLYLKCKKITDLENECECLQSSLREYNQLWKEKEYYQKRSTDLDALKEKYFTLFEETSNIETKLNAEQEINKIKSQTIDDLRSENIKLEQKIGDISLTFEKQKNIFLCKLKESECKVMCQEQQIKSLSLQIDELLEQDSNKIPPNDSTLRSIEIINEIESQKAQIQNLKEALCGAEEDKQYVQEEFEKKLELINELKLDVEDWKSKYEKALQNNNYLEKYLDEFQTQINDFKDKHKLMRQEIDVKTNKIEDLNNIIRNKCHEIKILTGEVDHKTKENIDINNQKHNIQQNLELDILSLKNERNRALDSVLIAKQESIELFRNLNNYEDQNSTQGYPKQFDMSHENFDTTTSQTYANKTEVNQFIETGDIVKELELLQQVNLQNINNLRNQNHHFKNSFELAKKESQILESKLNDKENLLQKFDKLKDSYNKLLNEKQTLEDELNCKTRELERSTHDFQLTKKKSESLLDQLNQSEKIYLEYTNLNDVYKKIVNERDILQTQIHDKDTENKELTQSLNSLKVENEHMLLQLQEAQQLEKTYNDLRRKYDELLAEKKTLQNDFNTKAIEINNLYNNFEKKIDENQNLYNQIKILQNRELLTHGSISALKDENYNMQLNLKAVKKESDELLDQIKYYENLELELKRLKIINTQNTLEKEDLLKNLNQCSIDLKKLEKENYELNSQNENLISHNNNLEKALIRMRDENILKTGSVQDFYTNIKKEVDLLKDEKLIDSNKIKCLLEKLDESDYFINNLNEEIVARDKKISTLENHINELEDEIRALQNNLIEVVESGEQLKKLSSEKLEQSLKIMEAHQAKATHNMKMKLARLRNEKENLEGQLSSTKLMTEESLKDKNNYTWQINQLQSEREVIVSDIQKLEVKGLGDSNLVPHNCTTDDIKSSLERIGKHLESKNISLEKTLLNVQQSYQILKSKADEAKNIAEQEKQKMIFEKEQVKKERRDLENQLADLKKKLKDEKLNYEKLSLDLQSETLNQKLIFDKIKQTKENDILKLTKENGILQSQCENISIEIKDLQQQLQNYSEEKIKYKNILEQTILDLEDRKKHIQALQKSLDDVKNKPTQQAGVQTTTLINQADNACQTDSINEYKYNSTPLVVNKEDEAINIISKNFEKLIEFDVTNHKNGQKGNKFVDVISNSANTVNDVQILTANVEPTIDFIKNIYLNYKIKRLRPGKLEQYSIASVDTKKISENNERVLSTLNNLFNVSHIAETSTNKNASLKLYSNCKNNSIIDIYNTRAFTNSTELTGDNYTDLSNKDPQCYMTSMLPETKFESHGSKHSSFRKDNKSHGTLDDLFPSEEKDLFVIYKDSDNNNEKQNVYSNGTSIHVTRESSHDNKRKAKNKKYRQSQNEKVYKARNSSDDRDDDSMKPRLQINLPRVIADSPSTITISDVDKKSLDSYTHAIYASPTRIVRSDSNIIDADFNNNLKTNLTGESIGYKHPYNKEFKHIVPEIKSIKYYFENNFLNNSLNDKMQAPKDIIKDDSHHNLTRVGANILVLQNTSNTDEKQSSEDSNIQSNYGLQYILNTVHNEINPNNIKNTNLIKSTRKSQSDENLNNIREYHKFKKNSSLKISSVEYRTTSSFSPISMKSVADRGTLVKMDDIEEYANKIQQLTKALENIEKDYKKKMDAVKIQYDSNVKNIINEHNHGVQSIQNLHEETLHDIIKIHENEVESLRSMSIEAMRKAERLEMENNRLKTKLHDNSTSNLDEEPIKIPSPDIKRRKCRCRVNGKMLTKTNVEAFNVKPRKRSHGPCTCSLDINISDTIRDIFEQVDIEQRKMAEQAYLKYIAHKILDGNVETLDAQELSFLHLKVCRTWKTKLNKEEALQKKIDSLESELINKQRQSQKHMAELDRKVAEEWLRLQEVREAVCKSSPCETRDSSPSVGVTPCNVAEKDVCSCHTASCNIDVGERRSAGDLRPGTNAAATSKPKRSKIESNRAVLVKLDSEGRREKVPVTDDTPTRLRRSHDRHNPRSHKK